MDLTFIKQIASHIGMFIPFIKRHIYSKEKFLNDIKITSGQSYAIEYYRSSNPPILRIWLQLINLSPYLDVEIDTITIRQLSIKADSNPCIFQEKDKKLGEKFVRKSVGSVLITFELSSKQVEMMNSIKQLTNVEANLWAKIFIESSLYKKEKVDIHLESIPCKIS